MGKKNVRQPTQREYEFCLAAVKPNTSATDAYFEAYPNFKGTRKTAKENASRLMAKSNVKATIARLRAQAAKPTIMTLQQLGEWWTKIIQDENIDEKVRVMASNALANFSYKVFERQKIRELEQAEKEGPKTPSTTTAGVLSFADFCEACAYPRPFEKQVEMMKFAFEDGAKLELGARGYGKTDYVVICGIAYMLYINRAFTFLVMTKEERRGKDIAGEVARCLECVGLRLDVRRSDQITLAGHAKKDPNLVALPLRSKSLRGRHPDFILCDDLITPDDVSEAERSKVEAVVAELFKLTKNICLIGQPAHAKDIYAAWRRRKGVKQMLIPYGTIPQLDHDLEAQRAAGVSEASIQASYFLEISEAERMPFDKVQVVDYFPRGGCAGFVDPAREGSDFTAFAFGAMNFDNFVVGGFIWPKEWDFCIEDMQKIMQAYQIEKFAFETNGLGTHPVRMLREAGANVRGWNSTQTASGQGAGMGKHGRIINAAMFREHIKLSTFIPPQIRTPQLAAANEAFIKQVLDYEYKARHDDAPDALANLLMYLNIVRK